MYAVKSAGNISLIDLSTGEKIFDSKISDELAIQSKILDNEREITLTLNDSHFTPETLQMLLGKNSMNPKYNVDFTGYRVVYVQKRKHKKKRINKKWLKRYGYKEVYIPFNMSLKNCTITQDEFDKNTYSIEGNI